jgi:hypothetical protein
MSNMTTARWANTRVSERLGTKYAKEQVMAAYYVLRSRRSRPTWTASYYRP